MARAREGVHPAESARRAMKCASGEDLLIDANVLIYLIDRDAGERHRRALEMLDRASIADCVLTLRYWASFSHAVIRKGKLFANGATAF